MSSFSSLPAGVQGHLAPASFSRFRLGKREQLRVPKDVQERLTRAGGKNLFGKPNFRLVWGWDPIEWRYSMRNWCYELQPRYLAKPNRWYLEKWFPPDHYGDPDTWRYFFTENINGREIDVCGPFPTFGGYEQLATLETPAGEFVNLTPTMIDEVVRLVERSRDINAWERRRRVIDQIENQDSGTEQKIKEICDDAIPAFEGKAHVALDNWGRATVVPRLVGVPE